MNRKLKVFALMAGILVICLVGVAIARTFNTNSLSAAQPDDNTALIERIQNSADHPLRIKEAADTPLKILSVNVKQISREDYQKLTGKVTELNFVYSVPEASLKDVSGKKITGVFFITRDLSTNKLKGLMMKDVAIEPGQTFQIRRGGTVKVDPITLAESDGTVRELTAESMSNENYWLPFADIDQLQVSVVVTFDDGTQWSNPEGGNQ